MELSELRKYGQLMKELKLTAFEVSDGTKTFRMERNLSLGNLSTAHEEYGEERTDDVSEAEDSATLEIKSPMVGLFYSSSAEDKDDYVTVGSQIRKGDTICIIEAMKLMNEIKAEEDGIIEQVLVRNGDAVEFGTPLFRYRRIK